MITLLFRNHSAATAPVRELPLLPPNAGHHLPAKSLNRSVPLAARIMRWRVRCMAELDGARLTRTSI